MKFIREAPGQYVCGEYRLNRTREGSLYSNEIMWTVRCGEEHLANVGTLKEAKVVAAAFEQGVRQ
jgi:hypothetical protein